ncbi:hypothetical protein GGS21DRAFT_535854 [Xylaria nigripes]|nr:hypothetical protein GGS21DRAFT_535854 [Xylaria nigripes]
MAARNSSPRSVADATRFTSSTPHANAKSTQPMPNERSKTLNGSAQSPQQPTIPRSGGPIAQETLEERVRRLRAAHLAAKQHNISRMDQIIGSSRRFFDLAHQVTVMGLIGFSGIALLVTVYAAGDMMFHNRKRRNEFFALQKQMQEDSLESARLAYMAGTASPEQITLVEDATAKAQQAGTTLPSLLSAPVSAAPAGGYTHDSHISPTTNTEREPEAEKKGITAWLFRGLKKEDPQYQPDVVSTSDVSSQSNTSSPISNTVLDQAKKAYEQERENQQKGGPLDQIGLNTTSNTDANANKKKGWLW